MIRWFDTFLPHVLFKSLRHKEFKTHVVYRYYLSNKTYFVLHESVRLWREEEFEMLVLGTRTYRTEYIPLINTLLVVVDYDDVFINRTP